MRRLPDRTLVYTSEYEERLREYDAREKTKSDTTDKDKGYCRSACLSENLMLRLLKPKRTMSASARRKIAAAQRARWRESKQGRNNISVQDRPPF